jgi:F-type H+-transporting ATPase subunit delta
MLYRTASKRYALALYELARESSCIDGILADMQALQRMIHASPDLASFLNNGAIARSRRRRIIDAVFVDKVQPLTWRFLGFLADKRRLGNLEEIVALIHEIHLTCSGFVRITLSSPYPIEPDRQNDIRQRIEQAFGHRVEMNAVLRPELLGGFSFRTDDVIHDYSIAGMLEMLRQQTRGGL